jgi:putative phosphonate metabolism protein
MSVLHEVWSEATRFALYYAPPRESAWWQAGCAWLGRDPETGGMLAPPPQPAGLAQPLGTLTVAPRRYGWHGTLVPPFRLAPGVTPEGLYAAAEQWALRQTRFEANVEAATLGRFVALRPADEAGEAALRDLAASGLRALGALRAAQTPAELAKRLDAPLTPRQRAYVEEWGYPYVFEEFRFHMTLSDSLNDAQTCAHLVDAWNAQMRSAPALPVAGAALFVEPQPGAPFALWRRLPFAEARA